MSCHVTTDQLEGLTCIRLENSLIQAEILPEVGAKLWTLGTRADHKQWIWHNPGVKLRKVACDANYDDNWAGGWEELFPNDAAGEFMGRMLPDHGEWWSQPWEWEIIEESLRRAEIRLWRTGIATEANFEKRISLDSDTSRLAVAYRIENLAATPLYFLFKQHLAIAARPGDILEVPGGQGTPVDLEFSTLIKEGDEFDWPHARGCDGLVDLSVLPSSEEMHREFVYLSNLPEGWCGVRDSQTGATIRLHFPREIFPYTWLFMTFGGWRQLYTVVLEPCTTMPKDLRAALARGRCAVLSPGGVLRCEVYAELLPGSRKKP